MREFLKNRSRRWGYDGWALKMRGGSIPLEWSVCTTRREARELLDERRDLFGTPGAGAVQFEIVKVRLKVEVVG